MDRNECQKNALSLSLFVEENGGSNDEEVDGEENGQEKTSYVRREVASIAARGNATLQVKEHAEDVSVARAPSMR